LKFGIYVHPSRPKVPLVEIVKKIQMAGLSLTQKDPEIAIVVGGDGTFGYFGRILSIPILFVGVQDSNILGSKARLAEISYDNLEKSLRQIEHGRYSVKKRKMLSINLRDNTYEVLTDAYLERGLFSGCIRYKVTIKDDRSETELCHYAIGNGIVISTSFGSSGYFSYPERLKGRMSKVGTKKFPDTKLGICHVIPTYLVLEKDGRRTVSSRVSYAVSNSSCIEMTLMRSADARLYGAIPHSRGISVGINDKITIRQSANSAQIIELN